MKSPNIEVELGNNEIVHPVNSVHPKEYPIHPNTDEFIKLNKIKNNKIKFIDSIYRFI